MTFAWWEEVVIYNFVLGNNNNIDRQQGSLKTPLQDNFLLHVPILL